MDVLRLIEEVKKRPILWDHRPDNKDRPNLTAIWQQVADELGSSVKSCKAKWRNLRDAFRAEVRRSQRRAEKYKNVCKNDPRAKGTSKWAYFVPLSFLVKSQRPAIASSASGSASPTQSRTKRNKNNDDHSNSQHSNEEKTATSTTATTAAAAAQPASASYVHDSEDSNCISFASDYDIKEEAVLILSDDDNDEEEDFEVDIDAEMFHNDEEDQDMLFNQFQNLATPQAMRRLSHSISVANAAAEEQQHKHEHQQQQQQQQDDLERKIDSSDFGNKIDILPAVNAIESESSEPTTTATTTSPTTAAATEANQDCKCAKRVDEQVHFLENLEREEEKLIKSTRQDITRCKEMLHVGDSDYNFLISFLPLMKKMSDLQNIHFRAKMSELLVHTMGMGPPAPSAVHTASSLSQVIATPLSSFNPASICTSAQTQPQLFILQQAPPNAATPVTTNAQIQQPIGNAQVTTSTTTQWN